MTLWGANHTDYSVISPLQFCLTHHLVWYVHFNFYSGMMKVFHLKCGQAF